MVPSPNVPEDLTRSQRNELKGDLQVLRGELERFLVLSRESAAVVELDQTKIGRVSRMDAMQNQKMVEANRREAEMRLRLVKAALNRFDRDEYGLCAECEEPVAFRRLKAKPEVRLCIGCQRELESRRGPSR